MKGNNIIKEKLHRLLLSIPLGIPSMDILPFQGANWNNRKLAQGVAVGLEYIAPSVRSKWLKTIYIPAQSNGLGYKTKTYKKRPEQGFTFFRLAGRICRFFGQSIKSVFRRKIY